VGKFEGNSFYLVRILEEEEEEEQFILFVNNRARDRESVCFFAKTKVFLKF
jgi:hypothetical protein